MVMRRRWLATALIACVLAVPVAAGKRGSLMDEVRELGDKISEWMVAGEMDKMLDLYAEDAISLPNYGPRMQGLDEFRKHHEQMTKSGMRVVSFESEPTEVWKAGDKVIELGTFEIELEMAGMPGPITDVGKYMTVYVRERGELKIIAETWNTDMNPMEMGGGGHDPHAGHDHAHGHGS